MFKKNLIFKIINKIIYKTSIKIKLFLSKFEI